MSTREFSINSLLEIGTALSAEKKSNSLLSMILNSAMDITNCDGGTLYIVSEGFLTFKIMVTKSMSIYRGQNEEVIDLPPVEMGYENVCAKAALTNTIICIDNVYDDSRFDFSGPRKYDALTGYKTTSMLVLPMEDDRGNVIGVLQLINALDDDGNTIPFSKSHLKILSSLASQAALRLTAVNYNAEILALFDSFVNVLSTAIDARSHYNANHTKNMVRFGDNFFNYLRSIDHPWALSDVEKSQFLMSVWLHDLGKLVIPSEIMDKKTRLGDTADGVFERFRIILMLGKISYLEGKSTEEEYNELTKKINDIKIFIENVNKASFLSDAQMAKIEGLKKLFYYDEFGHKQPYFTELDLENLSIRKGTLSDSERKIIENHVIMTGKMLSEMKFTKEYEKVPQWASSHHEFLNGQGYPNHLQGDEIEPEVRLITILDIFEALTASDRPYRPPMSREKAFFILDDMVKCGQLDGDILELFKASLAWADTQSID